MNIAQIRLTCRQVLDVTSSGIFAKQLLAATFAEFQLRSQVYNPEGRFFTFREMAGNDGRANSLHYKLYFAAAPYLELLEKQRATLNKVNHLQEYDEELIRKYMSLIDMEEYKIREKMVEEA